MSQTEGIFTVRYAVVAADLMYVKQAACMCLRNYIKDAMMNNQLGLEQIRNYLLRIFELTATLDLDLQFGELLSHVINSLVTSASGQPAPLIGSALATVAPLLKDALTSGRTIVSLQSFLTCLQQVLAAMLDFPVLADEAVAILDRTNHVIAGKVAELENLLQTGRALPEPRAEEEEEESPARTLAGKLGVIYTWIRIVSSVVEKASKMGANNYFPYSGLLAELFSKILRLPSWTSTAMIQKSGFIWGTGKSSLDLKANNVKRYVLKCTRRILEQLAVSRSNPAAGASPFLGLCVGVSEMLADAIIEACVGKYDLLENLPIEDSQNNVLMEIMSLFSTMLGFPEFRRFFDSLKEKLVVGVVFAILRSGSETLDTFANDPEEVLNVALDLCGKQASDVAKSEAARLLSALCANLEGCLSFVSAFSLRIVGVACRGENLVASMSEFAQFPFIVRGSAESAVETALMAISVIHQQILRRPDILYRAHY